MYLFCLSIDYFFPSFQSYEPTQSQFTKMGLWEVCFVGYVHEDDVEGRVWDGCYATVRTGKIRDIREWICPGKMYIGIRLK